MAHQFFDNLQSAIEAGDSVFTVDFKALNSSGGTGTVTLVRTGDMLTVAVAASGLTPGEVHLGHIHGTFDGAGNPTNATSPTIVNDTDGDGFVELLEGASSYGPIILPFVDAEGNDPMADENGNVLFYATYDVTDPDTFAGDFNAADIADLTLRHVVLHGAVVPNGAGAGTGGEVDGGVNGYLPIIPAVVGDIEAATKKAAMNLVETGRDAFGLEISGTASADVLVGQSTSDLITGLAGDDRLLGNGGNDQLFGGAGDDRQFGGAGDDEVFGITGNDRLYGGTGDDVLSGRAGNDGLYGENGNDSLFGSAGDDRLNGGRGDDLMQGGGGNDLFLYYGGDGADAIRDFRVGADTLEFRNIGMDDVELSDKRSGTLVTFDGQVGSVFVFGVTASDLADSILA